MRKRIRHFWEQKTYDISQGAEKSKKNLYNRGNVAKEWRDEKWEGLLRGLLHLGSESIQKVLWTWELRRGQDRFINVAINYVFGDSISFENVKKIFELFLNSFWMLDYAFLLQFLPSAIWCIHILKPNAHIYIWLNLFLRIMLGGIVYLWKLISSCSGLIFVY